jgi:hypothetical protein
MMNRCALDDGQASGIYVPKFYVFWGNVNLGYTDTEAHAETVIRNHINRRQHGDSRATMRKEYQVKRAEQCSS